MTTYAEVFRRATGNDPYPYQARIGEGGLPELIEVPTGLGKTAAVVTTWLYRRRYHDDPAVRAATPRRLVFVLPMRVLVEQTISSVSQWLTALDLANQVNVRVLMGGEPMRGPHDWRDDVDADAIVVGTVDMILSRCLNRGYGESRYLWPIDFGLLNSGSHFVFDEVQLMGPALATSRQLHGLRAAIGTAPPCASTWMSATVDRSLLSTVDAPAVGRDVLLDEDDLLSEGVRQRYRATKQLVELPIADVKKGVEMAESALSEHRSGTLTLVIANTVDRATAVHRHLVKLMPEAELVLLHSRFRPRDRAARVAEAVGPVDGSGPGRIVVSTQVVEAGVDISATTLITEVAPWPSLVQRAGRCNRDGRADAPKLVWVRLPKEAAPPYLPADLDASATVLESLSGADVDSALLGAQVVSTAAPITAVLRRRDLIELFDTFPDLSGNDVDVSRFIRNADDLDVAVAWRDGVLEGADGQSMPGRDERCSVPVKAFREWLKAGRAKRSETAGVWRWDALDREWVRGAESDVRPGVVFLVDSSLGGYTPMSGWFPTGTVAVGPVGDAEPAADDQSTADDPASVGASWVSLHDHLADTLRAANELVASIEPGGLSGNQRLAISEAGRLHDIGKAHEQFQGAMRTIVAAESAAVPDTTLLAKSASRAPLRYGRRAFRHELASALCLLGEGAVALRDVAERDLVVYLVAAHHGRVRVGVRPVAGDSREPVSEEVLGIRTGDVLPALVVPHGELPASTLDVSVTALGGGAGGSWVDRALTLRDRRDVGVFRLGFMEAVVRLADWRASADPTPLQLEVDHA